MKFSQRTCSCPEELVWEKGTVGVICSFFERTLSAAGSGWEIRCTARSVWMDGFPHLTAYTSVFCQGT